MDVPPSRYKVVEEGRRLVVLDRWNGNAPVAGHNPPPTLGADSPPATVEQARAALRPGSGPRPTRTRPPAGAPDPTAFTLITRPWFDNKAPRSIRVDGPGQGKLVVAAMVFAMLAILAFVMIGWPTLFVAGFFLMQPKVRGSIRSGVTLLLDALGEPVGE